jgi:hypothetical protein
MPKKLEWIGQRYSRLTVISLHERRGPKRLWLCRCDCGNDVVVQDSNLRSDHTRSCGCFHQERRKEARTTHGKTDAPIYDVWVNMKQRCFNPNLDSYPNYGGRGITVCDEWRDSFEAFYRYVGEPPEGTTIDRINNDGNYEPGNVKWSTATEQVTNRRRLPRYGKRFLFDGEQVTVHQLAARLNLSPATLYKRLDAGKTGTDLVAPADQKYATAVALSKRIQY